LRRPLLPPPGMRADATGIDDQKAMRTEVVTA
jgi:hypothetical protein